MAETTGIEWAHATFNPFLGCTKVSPACDNCYAETWSRRTGQPHLWNGERRRTTEAYWQQPHKWNRQAAKTGETKRVFCASLADVFDNQVPTRWRDDLWHMIDQTPALTWLLLTKRPQNIAKMLPDERTGVKGWGNGWSNVWLGTTTENQTEAERRIPHLLGIPAVVRFLSCEPLLGPLDIGSVVRKALLDDRVVNGRDSNLIGWIIGGGESGGNARPSDPDWFRSLRDDCASAGVAYFHKQMTKKAPIPDDLMVRQFPVVG